MSFARSALCSSIAAAALVTTFVFFAPEAETLSAPTAVAAAAAPLAPRPAAADAAPSRRIAKVVADSGDATCQKIRRKLWVEGEGWVVRRIATCH